MPVASGDGEVPWLVVRGARHHNLKNVDVEIPLTRFVCITGVSGSGKSSLVNDILYEALAAELNGATTSPGPHEAIEGTEHLDKIIAIDQTPIGRTPRSNPATYIKVFDEIRTLFAKLPDAKLRGYKPGRFSFNVAAGPRGGGRCEACEGNGLNRIQMDFLADVWVPCPVCGGKRFQRETLQIQYKHKSIADVLEMDVQQSLEHFENIPRIERMLRTLHDVGLDYIKLGQPSPTLSGGEAQRIKLARELVKKATGRTIYVLDEPTTGLHFEDIRRLLAVLHGFVDAGNTVIVIEHNLDVIKTADWVIDLGPEGGEDGGYVVATGTPETLAEHSDSHTGQALRDELARAAKPIAMRPRRRQAGAKGPRRASGHDAIVVAGAREHNLKDVSVSVPRDRMTVCTGVSGSGKTSFAIDTVFTEGYRRYVESLSAYARQFLGQMQKPRVDHVEGLSPAICIEQKAASKSPRSTVGTITEIYDYMRVLWARVGTPYCPNCNRPIGSQTVDEIVARVMAMERGAPIILLAPVRLDEQETYATLFNRLRASGYTRVRIDGKIVRTAEATTLDRRQKHSVAVVIDRTIVKPQARGRIAESVEHALTLGDGQMILVAESVEKAVESQAADGSTRVRTRRTREREFLFSQTLACLKCGTSFEPLGPHHFSFNSQMGWCEMCEGLGVQRGAPESEIIRDPQRSLFRGAIAGWEMIDKRSRFGKLLIALCETLELDPDTPLSEWNPAHKQVLMFGSQGQWIEAGGSLEGVRFQWRGFFPAIDAATRNSWQMRHRLRNVVTTIPCLTCRGGRLRPDAAAVRLARKTIVELCNLPLAQAAEFFSKLRLAGGKKTIAAELLHEIRSRLRFLVDVGLGYLTLHRAAPTLSGGEAQRIRLASQIGSGLSGVLYVLDEPTIGLHPRDTGRLISAIQRLRDLGNTLLLVEHDRDVIASADHLLDFGPRAGADGGQIVAAGSPSKLARPTRGAASLTREYLAGKRAVTIPANRRPVPPDGYKTVLAERDSRTPSGGHAKRRSRTQRAEGLVARGKSMKGRAGRLSHSGQRAGPDSSPPNPDAPATDWLIVCGARHNNLKNIDVPIPLGRLVCVTGVSGSGKSSLVNDIIHPALAARFQTSSQPIGAHREIVGADALDKVILSDQSPIGSTPSSNPATYTGAFDWIRELFARLPDSKMRGYDAGRFSFNRTGGRCDACEGFGQRRIEMHFMPDVWVTCEVCKGRRYNPETLEVKFKGRSIADVLNMRVDEALRLFDNVPKVRRMLQTLEDVGLGYIQLGQPAPTLSGGEAQRVKLAAELGKPNTGRTLYILDEPTTGLHFDDIDKLLEVLHRLVDLGNSVLLVEHNLDVIKVADWLIDLGPEAGEAGGRLVASGTPEAVSGLSPPEPGPSGQRGQPKAASRGKPVSHTGQALRPVLTKGRYEPRARFDAGAHAQAQMQAERGGYGDVGRHVRMPWQVDGRRWHLEQRTGRDGGQRRWEPAALEYVIELIEAIRGFEPTDWNNRASVEIRAADAPTWFMHALTGGEWLLELYFRAPRGCYNWRELDAWLGLKTLDEREDLQTYGDWARVDVRKRRDGWDAVVVYVHDKAEIDTPAFRRFVREIARQYLTHIAGVGKRGRSRASGKKRGKVRS